MEDRLSGVDYTKVEGLQRKRLLAFVNHFLIETSSFLSQFAQECDVKLASVSTRLQRLETSLALLENKLNSVPELRSISAPPACRPEVPMSDPPVSNSNFCVENQENSIKESETVATHQPNEEATIENDSNEDVDEELLPFQKMIQVGVPEAAVRQKMRLQGIDDSKVSFPSKT